MFEYDIDMQKLRELPIAELKALCDFCKEYSSPESPGTKLYQLKLASEGILYGKVIRFVGNKKQPNE